MKDFKKNAIAAQPFLFFFFSSGGLDLLGSRWPICGVVDSFLVGWVSWIY